MFFPDDAVRVAAPSEHGERWVSDLLQQCRLEVIFEESD